MLRIKSSRMLMPLRPKRRSCFSQFVLCEFLVLGLDGVYFRVRNYECLPHRVLSSFVISAGEQLGGIWRRDKIEKLSCL